MFKAHRLVYHSTLGSKVTKKKKKHEKEEDVEHISDSGPSESLQGYLAPKKQLPPLGPT